MSKKLTKAQIKKIKKRIRDRNYRFRKMTPEKQRITIAKDVIDQLEAGKLTAKTCVYLLPDEDLEIADQAADLKEVIDDAKYSPSADSSDERKAKKASRELRALGKAQVCDALENVSCTVCGIGATFAAAVKRADDLTFHEFFQERDAESIRDSNLFSDTIMRDYLHKYFKPLDIAMIECAFERTENHAIHEGILRTDSRVQDAVRFGMEYGDDGDRLIAIMENIIENRGEFKPWK